MNFKNDSFSRCSLEQNFVPKQAYKPAAKVEAAMTLTAQWGADDPQTDQMGPGQVRAACHEAPERSKQQFTVHLSFIYTGMMGSVDNTL
jgi:hypothetical protein